MTNLELLEEFTDEPVVIFENPSYESALIGVTTDYRAVYDYDLMVASLVEEDGMTGEEAEDFISYNTVRALPYMNNAPIIMYNFKEWNL